VDESPELVARFRTRGEAEAVRSALAASGIDAHLAEEALSGVRWLESRDVGRVRLFVAAADAERAREMIRCAAGEPASPDDDEEIDWTAAGEPPPPAREQRCPACGGEASRLPRLAIFGGIALFAAIVGFTTEYWETAGLLLAIGGLLLFFAQPWRCRSCGGSWSSEEEEASRDERPLAVDIEEGASTRHVCPQCGSRNAQPIARFTGSPFALVVRLPLLLIWPFLPKDRCGDCGTEW
jgi:uncharacterized protein with PIN domain